jgi:glycosyltransferase involved in cell wall biosynthesis
VKVLYVNHTSCVGGGEHSLLELINALPDTITPTAACPEGPLADRLRRLGVVTHPIPQLDGSLKLHPAHTPLTLARLRRAVRAVARAARSGEADLLHGNSIRGAIVAGMAARRCGRPAVAHIRDCLPPGRMSSLALGAVERHCDAVIANSRYTAERLPAGMAPVVVHNPVDLERFDRHAVSRTQARSELGVRDGELLLGMVAQITPWKAQDDAIRMLDLLRAGGREARLLLIGTAKFVSKATRFDNLEFLDGLHRLVAQLGLGRQVEFLGEREDVPRLLRALDLLLMPSWEEPFGRAAIEAMAMGTPVAATSVGGPPEIVRDGSDGLLLPPRNPRAWADAVAPLLADAERRERMGLSGRKRAVTSFGAPVHAARVVEVYEQLRPTATAESSPARKPRLAA